MDALLHAITVLTDNPIPYINFVFAFIAGVGVIYFGAGFFAGIPHLLTQSGHNEHVDHYRYWIVRGICILFYTFMLWELVRVVENWFGYGVPVDPQIVLSLYISYAIVLAILWVLFKIKSAFVDRGH